MGEDDFQERPLASTHEFWKNPVVQDAAFGLLLALVTIGLLGHVWTAEWGRVRTTDALGVRFVPTVALATILFGSLVYWLEFIRGKITSTADTSWQIRQGLLLALFGVIYLMLTFRLGIILGLIIGMPLSLALTGYRDLRKILGLTVGFGIIVYIMFGVILDIFLPRALWF